MAIAWVACAALVGCGGAAPAQPAPAPNGSETITGAERFGWDQLAADAAELATFRYALYVDDARIEATEVSCTPGPTAGRFACTARMPPMSAGAHNIEVASYVLADGVVKESARSIVVRVTKQ
jgi:hypothetical protein